MNKRTILAGKLAGNMNKRTILAGKIAGNVNKRTILAGNVNKRTPQNMNKRTGVASKDLSICLKST